MTPVLQTKYVFTITALIGEVVSAGDIGHGVRRVIPIIEALMKLLDGGSDAYRRGKHPDPKEARQIATLLRAVAGDLEP